MRRGRWSGSQHGAILPTTRFAVAYSYRRDFWDQQPLRVEVWSEKGTIRGVLQSVLDEYAVSFNVLHGFGSATSVYGAAQSDNERPLVVLYVGDWDPSGLCMSERDLPERLARYGGDHVTLKRVALTEDQLHGLPSFPAADKKKDKRFAWFAKSYGDRCWELDAMDPGDLRACVKNEIERLIEPTAWARCVHVNKAEQKFAPDRARRVDGDRHQCLISATPRPAPMGTPPTFQRKSIRRMSKPSVRSGPLSISPSKQANY